MRVDFEEAKKEFSELIGKVVFGDDKQVIITKNGMPIVRITDYYDEPSRKRKIGIADGRFRMPTDEEWKAMDKEVEEMFEVSANEISY